MTSDLHRQYEAVRYDDVVVALTDPGLLGALGRLFGLGTADPARCRVLELGCGQGLNLLAMAARFPQSRFVGLDFVEAGLQEGRAMAAQAGLTNVELIHADLLDYHWDGEPFDYIIAWGVFSWVPDEVKERLLALTRACLAPQGVACICYLTYPGCKINEAMRDLMRLRADVCEGHAAQVDAARSVLQALQRADTALQRAQPAQLVWVHQAAELLRKSPSLLFHDELGGTYDPCYLLQFVDWAQEHRLAYVTDADSPASVSEVLPPAAQHELRAVSDNALEREQISDYLSNRTLRVSVLTRDVDAGAIAFTPDAVRGLCLGSSLEPRSEATLLARGSAVAHRFADARGVEATVDDRFTAALLHVLHAARGQRLPWAELWPQALALVGGDAPADAERTVGSQLFGLIARKLVTASLAPWRVPAALPAAWCLTPLNRLLLQRRGLLATATQQALPLPPADAAWLAAAGAVDGADDQQRLLASHPQGRRHAAALLAKLLALGCLAEPVGPAS